MAMRETFIFYFIHFSIIRIFHNEHEFILQKKKKGGFLLSEIAEKNDV